MGKVVQLTASIGKWFHKYIEFGKNDCRHRVYRPGKVGIGYRQVKVAAL